MPKRIVISERAILDIDELAAYIARDDERQAARYLEAAYAAIDALAEEVVTGAPYRWTHPRLQPVKRAFISGFPNHLIFYVETPEAISVVRVLHGARDLPSILEDE